VLTVSTFLALALLLLGMAPAAQEQPNWIPNVSFPRAPLSPSLGPTQASFANSTFSEFGKGGERAFSARLRNGQYEEHFKPYGSVEIELTGFHRIDEGETLFVVATYHKVSVGGSSSNDCFVDVVAFPKGTAPTLIQRIKYGCDSAGSGADVSANATEVTVREEYKGDSQLTVVQFKWNGQKFDVVGHRNEPIPQRR